MISALWTEVCLTFPALMALEAGYEVYVVTDTSGGTSVDAHERSIDRMVQAGAAPVTWQQVLLEYQRDWARKDTYDAVMALVREHSGAYGMGVDYAYTMVHHAPARTVKYPLPRPCAGVFSGVGFMAHPQHVTLVITHRLAPGNEQAYEAWLNRIMPDAAGFTGHLGVNVIRPAGDEQAYTVLVRFDNLDNLYRWIHSPLRKQYIEEVTPLLLESDHIEIRPGAEFWFTPPNPGVRQPPQWKQFIITLLVIFPSTNLVPWFWGWCCRSWTARCSAIFSMTPPWSPWWCTCGCLS